MQGQSIPVLVKGPYTGSILMHVGSSCKHTGVYNSACTNFLTSTLYDLEVTGPKSGSQRLLPVPHDKCTCTHLIILSLHLLDFQGVYSVVVLFFFLCFNVIFVLFAPLMHVFVCLIKSMYRPVEIPRPTCPTRYVKVPDKQCFKICLSTDK